MKTFGCGRANIMMDIKQKIVQGWGPSQHQGVLLCQPLWSLPSFITIPLYLRWVEERCWQSLFMLYCFLRLLSSHVCFLSLLEIDLEVSCFTVTLFCHKWAALVICIYVQKGQQRSTHTLTKKQPQQEANRQIKVTLCSRNSFIITWTMLRGQSVFSKQIRLNYYFIASLVVVCFPVARWPWAWNQRRTRGLERYSWQEGSYNSYSFVILLYSSFMVGM